MKLLKGVLCMLLAGSSIPITSPAYAETTQQNPANDGASSGLNAGWIGAFDGLSLGFSPRSVTSYSPITFVLTQNGITEDNFKAAPVAQKQIWVTQARRLVQAQAEPTAVEILKQAAQIDISRTPVADILAMQNQLSVLDEIYGPFLPEHIAQALSIVRAGLSGSILRGKNDALMHSARKMIAALGIKVDSLEVNPMPSSYIKLLPRIPEQIQGSNLVGQDRLTHEFHIFPQQMALIDLTGTDGGHHIRVTRFDGDEIALIYGTREFTRLSPGETIDIGRAPQSSRKILKTEADPGIADHHMSIQYIGNGKIGIVDHSGKGFSISAAIGGTNSIAGRYSSILGRMFSAYNSSETYGEIVRVEISGPLQSLYEEIRRELSASPNLTETGIVELVVRLVIRNIPTFNMESALAISELYKFKAEALGPAILSRVGGVCRHFALSITSLLEQLIHDGILPGKAYYSTGAVQGGKLGHAWAEYEASNGMTYVLDPSQRKYGPIYEYQFVAERTAENQPINLPYSKFGFPAENR